jgi:hypothetical protein
MRMLVLFIAFLVAIDATWAASGKVLSPARGIYHSANPDFSSAEDKVSAARIADFERLAGKKIVWAYFSDNWSRGIKFPARSAQIIRNAGRIPFVRILTRRVLELTCADKAYSPQKIIDGRFDAELKAYARAVKAFGPPILMEWGTEANGDWFQWSGACNGGATLNGYGKPNYPDGPERVRDAYRHIVDLFRGEGADFVTWVFHMNGESAPDGAWNRHARYYPGDDYVDWIGVSVYGALTPAEVAQGYTPSFASIMDKAYPELVALSANKPIALLEFGVTQYSGKAKWLRHTLSQIAAMRWPKIKAISSWNDRWQNADGTFSNLRIDSSPAALAAFKAGVASSVFVTTPAIGR